MNRITMLYQLDLLLKNCKGCSHNSENGSPETRCNGCSFYPQIRYIGENLGRKKQMAKLTLEEYQDYKAQGMTDTQIAIKIDTFPQYLSKLKKKWNISPNQANTAEIKQKECTCKGKENNARYEQEISDLKASKNELQWEFDQIKKKEYKDSYVIEGQKKRIEDLGKTLKLYESENKAMRELLRLWI